MVPFVKLYQILQLYQVNSVITNPDNLKQICNDPIMLPLVAIFQYPTLSALAELVTQLQKQDSNGSRYRGRILRYRPTVEDFLPSLKKLAAHEIDALLIKILTEEVHG